MGRLSSLSFVDEDNACIQGLYTMRNYMFHCLYLYMVPHSETRKETYTAIACNQASLIISTTLLRHQLPYAPHTTTPFLIPRDCH